MTKAEVPDEGGAAWRRLTSRRGGSRSGDDALTALADIGAVRRLLDQWELDAVRIARRRNKSWAEIATYLGVTRQSAWERWRDLDSEPAPGGVESSRPAVESAAAEVSEWERDLLEAGARDRRRRANVEVPSVVGLEWAAALRALTGKGLAPASADPDTALPDPAEAGWFVTDQSPESGARVAGGSAVRLWLRRNDGGSGVREPRQPMPPLRSIPELPEPTGRTAS
ncbi:PASTA domain-containing protein [Nocardia sp. CA2R105]|uniref:PASTA domain-containing protein n=1 Tax=Nocardia coffeae TaxID=2873381 RepID=UPI001CA79AD8|nr:PASTA domain-containing protein [Nocardia coffeae]MBY8860722.1 PASTA domain-containing protein [Nocardia coffeae]